MIPKDKIELREFLYGFLTDHKKQLFEKILNQRTRHMTIVLEDIYQSQNASAVLRSAEIAGVQDIHIIENYNNFEVNSEIDMGSSKWLSMKWYRDNENSTENCLASLKNQGYKLIAASPHFGGKSLEELPLDTKTALLFGTELRGLSQTALSMADGYMFIPMYGFTESFNISVSAALSMYSYMYRLRNSDVDWHLSEKEKIDLQIQWAKSCIKSVDLILERYHSGSLNLD